MSLGKHYWTRSEIGGFLDIEKVREKYVEHETAGDLTSFKRYFLNIWDQKENLAIDMQKWDASAGDWEAAGLLPQPVQFAVKRKSIDRKVRPLPVDLMSRFLDRKCWAGVDLSMTTDTSSAIFCFERADAGYDVLPFFWLPDANLLKMERSLGVPLRQWAKEGWIELCPGEVIDYRDIQARLEWAGEMFDLQEICWDPWNSRQISVQMIDEGYRCVEVRQGFATLSEPTKKLLSLVATGKLNHGNHPVLRWQAGCATLGDDKRDNVMLTKPDRQKSTSRIDGMAAIVNALARAIEKQPEKKYQAFVLG